MTNLTKWRKTFRADLERIADPLRRLAVHDARCAIVHAHSPEDCEPKS